MSAIRFVVFRPKSKCFLQGKRILGLDDRCQRRACSRRHGQERSRFDYSEHFAISNRAGDYRFRRWYSRFFPVACHAIQHADPIDQAMGITKPLLTQWKINSSQLLLFRGAELTGELRPIAGNDLALDRLPTASTAQLLKVHAPLGQAELGDRWRSVPEFPWEAVLSRAPLNRQAQAVMRLMRSDQGWRAQIDVLIDNPNNDLHHVFWDLPSSLTPSFRDPIETNVSLMIWPSADTNRSIVCLVPQVFRGGKSHLTLTVRLPSSVHHNRSQCLTYDYFHSRPLDLY